MSGGAIETTGSKQTRCTPGHERAALESRESTGDDSHLAQTQPWLPLPVEGREPGQQHPQEEQQQVDLRAA